MPRYLTAGKVGLLALIDLYLSGQTASSARLNVLDFIASHVNAAPGQGTDLSHLSFSLTQDASEVLKPSRDWASSIPGRSVHDILLQRLWTLDGLDSLLMLFEDLGKQVSTTTTSDQAKRGLSRASPLGQFIRRCSVEFTRLQFADFQALWDGFRAWRASTYDTWARKHPTEASRQSVDASFSGADVTIGEGPVTTADAVVSSEDADTILTFSIHQLQKLGTRLPEDVRHKLQSWVEGQLDSGAQSLQHFLAFFEHWKAGQYTMALDSLHRYFDYSLVAKSGTDNMRVYYQYALLHLSVLHADFDCWDESVEAMDECIATARENQDTACLNFALSWLLYLRQAKASGQASPFGSVAGVVGAGGHEQDEVAFLKTKAKETKHWSLLSSTLLDEAKLEMYERGTTSKALEHITQSQFLNMLHDLRTLMPVASLFSGASLDRLGLASLAGRTYEELEVLHCGRSPSSDRVRAACRIAYGSAQSGRYNRALHLLQEVNVSVRGVLKLEQRIKAFVMLVQMTRSLRNDNISEADYHFRQLQPLRSFSDPEIDFEIFLTEIDLLLKRQEPEKAWEKVNAQLRKLKGTANADIGHRLHLLVLKSRIFASCNQSTKAFSIAMRVVSSSSRYLLVPIYLEAIVALTGILNDLSEFVVARQLLEAALPMIFESRQARLLAQAMVTLAESHVGAASHQDPPGSTKQTQGMRSAENYVERAREVYASLEDFSGHLECLCMKAELARWRDDDASAAHADALYLQLLADKQVTGTTS